MDSGQWAINVDKLLTNMSIYCWLYGSIKSPVCDLNGWRCCGFCSKIRDYSPSEASKVYSKPVTRKSGIKFSPHQVIDLVRCGSTPSCRTQAEKLHIVTAYIEVVCFFIAFTLLDMCRMFRCSRYITTLTRRCHIMNTRHTAVSELCMLVEEERACSPTPCVGSLLL